MRVEDSGLRVLGFRVRVTNRVIGLKIYHARRQRERECLGARGVLRAGGFMRRRFRRFREVVQEEDVPGVHLPSTRRALPPVSPRKIYPKRGLRPDRSVEYAPCIKGQHTPRN